LADIMCNLFKMYVNYTTWKYCTTYASIKISDKTHAGLMFMMICMKHVSLDVPSIHVT